MQAEESSIAVSSAINDDRSGRHPIYECVGRPAFVVAMTGSTTSGCRVRWQYVCVFVNMSYTFKTFGARWKCRRSGGPDKAQLLLVPM